MCNSVSSDICLAQNNIFEMQLERLKIFKCQDFESDNFDVTFEIDGKELHAHKFILTSISKPFATMLSARWTTENHPIKIKTSSYQNFYEFLRFAYIGNCNLNDENIFQLIDMAECYDVALLKNLCDKFLSNSKIIKAENVEEMYEFAMKYSLPGFMESVKAFIHENSEAIAKAETFLAFSKSFIQLLITTFNENFRDELFEAVYKWIKSNVIKECEDADLQNAAIKTELNVFFPNLEFHKMQYTFLINFIVENGFLLSPTDLRQFYEHSRKSCNNEENIFLNAYDISMKQAMKKQQLSTNEGFDIFNSIKADFAEIIPIVNFARIDESFLMYFIVPKRLLTTEEASCIYVTRVEIENCGNILSGTYKDIYGIRQHHDNMLIKKRSKKEIEFELKFPILSTPAPLKKTKDIKWYLCIKRITRNLSVTHHSMIKKGDYLIAELKCDETKFRLDPSRITIIRHRDPSKVYIKTL